ncbi:uncharacterized protein LOC134206209 [Armigeres subalbatus]|uniref:uncharacterized protein LOC134206209 n=1 Tax=Armigeres subalbatus TaxID=124917 RepID=UPI002ED51E9A
MNRSLPRAEDLNLEEIDYELSIRNQPEDVFKLDVQGKQRHLRLLFKADQKEGQNYRSNLSIQAEAEHISARIDNLEKALSKKVEAKYESRVIHYYYRVKRCMAETEEGKKLRRELSLRIEKIMQFYQFGPSLSPYKEQINTIIQRSEGAVGLSGQDSSATPKTSTIKPVRQSEWEFPNPPDAPASLIPEGSNRRQEETIEVSRSEWEDMKRMLAELTRDKNHHGEMNREDRTRNTGNLERVGQQANGMNEPRRTVRRPTSYADELTDSDSEGEDPQQFRRNTRINGNGNDRGSYEESMYSYDSGTIRPGYPRGNRHGRHRQERYEERGHGRVEKWKLRFSGDSRGMSVENFIYKATKLAEREGVSKALLLRDIHMLLEGAASDWFFTYVDDLVTWEDFTNGITYRFGNPNKDQGIRSKIQERKQLRGESFIAFVSEIEKLDRMLSKPLSRRRKFEVIWDNMRQHYRSKISIVRVRDLQQLIDLNYRIDAADHQLHQSTSDPMVRRPINQILATEDDSDYEQEAPVNHVRGQQPRSRPVASRNFHEATQQELPARQRENVELGPGRISCWNCLEVYHIKIRISRCPHIRVKVLDYETEALLDSGAGISILNSMELIERFRLKLQPAAIRVATADGSNYACQGFVNIPFTYKDVTKVIPTIVVPEISRKIILGADFWEAFGIKPMIDLGNGPETLETVSHGTNESICFTLEPTSQVPDSAKEEEDETLDIPVFEGPTETMPDPESIETEHELSAEERQQLMTVIKGFELTSTGKLGRTSLIQHEIILKEGAKPRNPVMYKGSPYMQEAIKKEVERFKALDAIEECYSEWTNPLVPVPKKNGKVRVCLDSRKINKLTVKDSYPMRNMQDIFRRLGKARYFSVIDLKDAYFQIPLKEESRNFTAFRTSEGVFRFKVLPFGVINAPFTMSRLMDRALGFDLEPRVFVYLDDIVIATETLEEHLRLLEIVGNRLRLAGLTISLEKSRFCRKQVMYLGYLLNEHGIAIDSGRIQPILDYARPKTQEDIRRLLGLAGFYQRFIKEYSRVVAPITDLLTKENRKFTWSKEAEEAFRELKSILTSAPILGNPDFNKVFTIESDASDRAVGAALVQEQEGVTKVISYFSKKLNRTQRRYSAVEKECLGVLSAIQHFRHYIEGTKFRVVTDARSLLWLFNIGTESGNAKLMRWALRIQAYDFDLEYRKGKSNITADCLSRSIEVDVLTISLALNLVLV